MATKWLQTSPPPIRAKLSHQYSVLMTQMELIKTIQISKQNRAGQIAHSDRGEQVRIKSELEDMVNLKTEILKNNGDCGMSQ